jgi:serine/threonine protein kinase/dipeptidyl aminopeptidase/acylaminoacyl peptidase
MIGETITHYRVLDTLGSGGMGVVYLAEDTKLKRAVALKFLSPVRATDEEAKRRFIIEARAASALDHPNIGTIYEIDEAPDGRLFIAMAYYGGRTLREIVARGPLPVAEARDYAIQIASGLAKAHAAGIVHRDIKPANLLVTADGLVKIVDFGVVKWLGEIGGSRTNLTGPGAAIGTPAYMSPEQTIGSGADGRSDVWALGVVFYEMLAGHPPASSGHSSPAAAIVALGPPPPLSSIRDDVPAALDAVVRRALSPRLEERYQSAEELLAALHATAEERVRSTTLPMHRRHRVAIAGAVAIFAALLLGYASRKSIVPASEGIQLVNPQQLAGSVGVELLPSWSADGRILAYQSDQAGNNDIWVMQIGGEAVNRTADSPVGDEAPRLSPDGRLIAFWSARDGGGVYIMPTLGGSPRKIATARPDTASGVTWSPDGSRIAIPMFGAIARGEPRLDILTLATNAVTKISFARDDTPARQQPPVNGCLDTAWSPNGRFIACVAANSYNNQTARLWVIRLEDRSFIPVTDNGAVNWTPGWSPDSRALFVASNRAGGIMDLFQHRLTDAGHPDGDAQRVTTGLDVQHAATSANGERIAYAKGRRVANVWRAPILANRLSTWADAKQVTFDQAYIESFDLSPDGRRLAIQSDRGGFWDIWILSSSGGELQQLTDDAEPDWWPAWSPDGSQVAFYSNRDGMTRELWVQRPASGGARRLTTGGGNFPKWTPDGKRIFVGVGNILAVPAGDEPAITRRDATMTADIVVQNDPLRQVSAMEMAFDPNGRSIVVAAGSPPDRRLWRVELPSATFKPLTKGQAAAPYSSPDGKWIYFHTFRETATTYQLERPGLNIWRVSRDGRLEAPVTQLSGRRGVLGATIATDGTYVYFTWRDDVSDIWMMDVRRQ